MMDKVTSAQVRLSLAQHFSHPTYGIVFEVAKATGYGAGRHIDALAMGLWPSRGLDLIAIEIKVSRGDFRRELQNPQKAEELAQFCDRFYIAAPVNLIRMDQLPPNWGLLERLDDGSINRIKEAVHLSPKPVGRDLLAAVFRAACRPADPLEIEAGLEARRRELEATISDRVKRAVKQRHVDNEHDAQQWRNVCAALGESNWCDDEEVVRAVKLVMRSGVLDTHRSLKALHDRLECMVKDTRSALEDFRISADKPARKVLS